MVERRVLRGGSVIMESAAIPIAADVAVVDGRIDQVGSFAGLPGEELLDCTGRLIMPGMIDLHTHADAAVFEPAIALALLRQGITTVIAGQDGVSYAPGDGAYATRYFAAINGSHPSYTGATVDALLKTYDRATPVNVGYLVPAGTVRHEVMGLSPTRPDHDQLETMVGLVRQGLAEGAFGLSTGLDYTPGLFADADEIAALCAPLAEVDGLYVTHMRGGYEENSAVGIDEIVRICREADVRGHVSHLHARSELIMELVDTANREIDLSFDSYPYSRGCTVLGMLLIPPSLLQQGFEQCVRALRDPAERTKINTEWVPQLVARADMGPAWADNVQLGHIAAPEFDWAHGLSLAAAAERAETTPADLGLQMLAAADLEVNVVMRTPVARSDADMAGHLNHPASLGGSDGIYRGRSTHPRGWGAFARYLDVFVRQRGDLDWAGAARHYATGPADRLGLRRRGRIGVGAVADLIVVDPDAVRSTATYEVPRSLAEGVDDVLVNGVPVLRHGQLTGALAGIGLRRGRD